MDLQPIEGSRKLNVVFESLDEQLTLASVLPEPNLIFRGLLVAQKVAALPTGEERYPISIELSRRQLKFLDRQLVKAALPKGPMSREAGMFRQIDGFLAKPTKRR